MNSRFSPRFLERLPVKIICMALALGVYILFRVSTLTERQISLPLKVLTSQDFVVSSEYPRTVNVTMRGEDEEIKSVLSSDIEVFVDLRSLRENGKYEVPVELSRKGSALEVEALELVSRPRELVISQERRTIKSLTVEPDLYGFPSSGFELTQYFVSPSTVTAVGPESQMAELEALKTELIDLSGRNRDFSLVTRIIPPSSQISIPGGQILEFRGVIEEIILTETFEEMEVVMLDLSADFKLANALPKVSMTVQGSQLAVEGTRPGELTFFIDGSDIQAPGAYTLPLRVDVPSGLAVLELEPQEVVIEVAAVSGGNS